MFNYSDETEAGNNIYCYSNLQSSKCICNQQCVHVPLEAWKKLQNPLIFAIIVSFKLSWCMKYPWNRNLEMAFRMGEMYYAEYRTLGQEVAYTLVKTP